MPFEEETIDAAMACRAPGPIEVTTAHGSSYTQRNAVAVWAISTSFRN